MLCLISTVVLIHQYSLTTKFMDMHHCPVNAHNKGLIETRHVAADLYSYHHFTYPQNC